MKPVYRAVKALLLLASMVVLYFGGQTVALSRYCKGVELGTSLTDLKEEASSYGFTVEMNRSFTELKIEPSGPWHSERPACRVIFNRNQAVAYRFWQSS